MQYDFIGISLQKISGVKNPLLTIIGNVKNKKYDFKVFADNNEIDFNLNIDRDNFILTCILKNNQKNIKVYYLLNNQKYLIYEGKNTIIRRLKSKINSRIKNILSLLKAIIITLGKGIKYLWKEYHFLVPPKLWKKYFYDFKNRVNMRGETLFYNPFNIEEYNYWLDKNEKESEIIDLNYKPLISILIPVYNVDKRYLSECIESVLNIIILKFV